VTRKDGPALLGWAQIAVDVPDDTCAFAVSTASLLGLVHDARITLRRIQPQRPPT
jgi:hypothetical protein